MLRCPPSRINLTASDIGDFEQRFIARTTSRLAPPSASNIRLSPGPARSTSLSFVPAEQNVSRKRAASSSSEAALQDGEAGTLPGTHTNRLQSCFEAARALESVAVQGKRLLGTSPHRQSDGFNASGVTERAAALGQSTQHLPRGLDGATDTSLPHSASVVKCELMLTESTPGDYGTGSRTPMHHQPRPHLLSSARARRRNGHSHIERTDINVSVNDQDSDLPTLRTRYAPGLPELVSTRDGISSPANPALDPGAPVFVPQTRFGTTTRSGLESTTGPEPRWSSVDSTHSSFNLRIRSSSERNSDFPLALQHVFRVSSGASASHASLFRDVENVPRQQRARSSTAHQVLGITNTTANLDRYPPLRPPGTAAYRQPGRMSSLDLAPDARIVSPSAANIRITLGSSHYEPSTRVFRHPSFADASTQGEFHRSASASTIAQSWSTPHLAQNTLSPGRIYSRGSSFSWSRSSSQNAGLVHPQRLVSAASGISDGRSMSVRSTRAGLDAATEMLRARLSPLDDLTERLSRLSSSRPRSVGQSMERPPRTRPRVSLLAGNPFRPEQQSERRSMPQTHVHGGPAYPTAAGKAHISNDGDTTVEDLVALSLALPPSSSLPATPPGIPSTPPILQSRGETSSTTPARKTGDLGYSSPSRCIKRKPVPSANKTSKVAVYDDGKPPHTQAQTSRELTKSTRRAKARSETAVQQSPLVGRPVEISTPPVIPESHPYRYTYPPISTQAHMNAATDRSTTLASPVRTRTHEPRNRIRVPAQRSDEHVENDLEGHLVGLEQDRRTWMSRQEGGNLDITPPREGRFERYLS